MKFRHLLLFGAVFFFSLSLVSCEKDGEEGRFTDFEVPELTDSNTVSFTVTVDAGEFAHVTLNGGKLAVDWGDGAVTKDKEPGRSDVSRMDFYHTYKRAGEYTVRIWSDQLTFINVSGLLRDYTDLRVGVCPLLNYAVFNTFAYTTTFTLDGCPELETLYLGNWQHLEEVSLQECTELVTLRIYTNPVLSTLDLGRNTKLAEFSSSDCGIEDLRLPKSIINVDFRKSDLRSLVLDNYTKLRSLVLAGNEQLETLILSGCNSLTTLDFSGTSVAEFDFFKLPALKQVLCSGTALTEIDVNENGELMGLDCSGNGLTTLDISNNPKLRALNCGDNRLVSLDVSANPYLTVLYVDRNELDSENLETIFADLPLYDPSGTRDTEPQGQRSQIKIYGNPGTQTCDLSIIVEKGWMVKVE